MSEARRVLHALLRTNFAAFAMRVFQHLEPGTEFLPNWHHDALAYELDRVRTGEEKRLVINLPPRTAKPRTCEQCKTGLFDHKCAP